jgi:hypothetical protein
MPCIKIAPISAKGKIFHAQAPLDPAWESKEGLVAPFFAPPDEVMSLSEGGVGA